MSIATKAIELSHAETPRRRVSLRVKMTAAGMYIRYSETRTVARMYILRSGSSMPLEESRANQAGLIREPLFVGLICKHQILDEENKHLPKQPTMVGRQRWIV